MKSIALKMSQVGQAIGWGIPKDGSNKSQGYDFTSAANVRITVAPQLAKRNIAVSSVLEVLSEDHPVSKSGSAQHRVMIRARLTFVDADSGETLSAEGIGCGMDSGDKAPMKAVTAAEKYAYVSAFTLAMGEDPERDEDDKPIGAPLRSYAYGPEEAARAEAQAQSRPQDLDAAVIEAKALVDEFRSLTCREDVLTWAKIHATKYDALPTKPKDLRTRVWTALVKHLETIPEIGITAGELKTELARLSRENAKEKAA